MNVKGNYELEGEINDHFPIEQLFKVVLQQTPLYANLDNYEVRCLILEELNFYQKKRFFSISRNNFLINHIY